MDRPTLFRLAAIGALVAAVLAAAATIDRRPATPVEPDTAKATVDDLAVELGRCRSLGPRDAEDPRCVAVWEENRRRFFGGQPRSLPSPTINGAGTAPAGAVATDPSSGGAR